MKDDWMQTKTICKHPKAVRRMQLSLTGLSVGDALGETFFGPHMNILKRIKSRVIPPGPWYYTDDTEMALSVVEVLAQYGRIDQDASCMASCDASLQHAVTDWHSDALLRAVHQGADWRREARRSFGGRGSYGNGTAMRIAPLGAYYFDDLAALRQDAILAAETTHSHAEGIAGAVAVAVGAALAARVGDGEALNAVQFLHRVLDYVPPGETGNGIACAAALPSTTTPVDAANTLGSGQRVSAQDTVPFVLWCAAHHLDNYKEAFWSTVSGLGDRDTTCAMVGRRSWRFPTVHKEYRPRGLLPVNHYPTICPCR